METRGIRIKSLETLAKVGISIPATLPLLEDFSVRPAAQIVDRIACLHAVAATSHGFDRVRALAWLSQEGVLDNLTNEEHVFLKSNIGNPDDFQVQVEGMWALTWIVGVVPELDFWRGCDPRFVTLLPNLKIGEGSSQLRLRAKLRSDAEIGCKRDLAYCLHWAIRDAEIRTKQPPDGLKHCVILERRRALEWATGSEAWAMVSLDT